jgi:hypothetical protein
MIYKAHKVEFERIFAAMYDLTEDNPQRNHTNIIKQENFNYLKDLTKALQDSTKCYVDLVNSHLEAFKTDTSKSKDQSVSGKDTSAKDQNSKKS